MDTLELNCHACFGRAGAAACICCSCGSVSEGCCHVDVVWLAAGMQVCAGRAHGRCSAKAACWYRLAYFTWPYKQVIHWQLHTGQYVLCIVRMLPSKGRCWWVVRKAVSCDRHPFASRGRCSCQQQLVWLAREQECTYVCADQYSALHISGRILHTLVALSLVEVWTQLPGSTAHTQALWCVISMHLSAAGFFVRA